MSVRQPVSPSALGSSRRRCGATRSADGADRWWATSRRSGSDVTPPSAPTVAVSAASEELEAWVPRERGSRY
jgi:hypothetical protein